MADDSIIAKIRALRAKASNAASTEAEVEAAAAAITKLMMKYDVEESDLVERTDAQAVHAKTGEFVNDMDFMVFECLYGIQTLTETKSYRSKTHKGARFGFIGHEPDVEMALYLQEMLVITARREWCRYVAGMIENGEKRPKSGRRDFYVAFARRICIRMMQLAEERQSARSGSTALVVAKSAIIRERMQEDGLVLRKSRAKGHMPRDRGAIAAASSAADRVNLNRPFSGTTKQQIR